MNAKDALEHFRTHRNGPKMQKALANFNGLSDADKLELLFWAVMSTNNALKHVAEHLELPHEIIEATEERGH